MYKVINYSLSIIASIITFAFGGFSILVKALIFIMVLDYITGILSAISNKKLSSKIGLKGIIKKIYIIVLVSVAHIIDGILGLNFIVRNVVIYFYFFNEVISILENCIKIGLPVPKVLVKICDEFIDDGYYDKSS